MTRRFQFSLRALLVLVLVVAAFFGGARFGEIREQRRLAAERIKVKAAAEKVMEDIAAVRRATKALSALKASREYPEWGDRLIEVEQRLSEASP